jgi:predicted aspartyl protease
MTVHFLNLIAYTGNRPYADVEIFGPSGSTSFKALVDTGADYLTLPVSVGIAVGYDPAKTGTPMTAHTASGSVTSYLMTGISIKIESQSITASVLFTTASSPMPLLGREAILPTMHIGFDPAQWMWV